MESSIPVGSFPDLIPKLCSVLAKSGESHEILISAISDLEDQYGATTYRELLYLLAHLQFPLDEAEQHWKSIVELRERMESTLRMPVDLRVALVSYFVDVNRKLKSPKVIELKLFQETQASVFRDALTGLFNYRYFREELSREIQRCERYKSPFSLIMIDIDNFKAYNDEYGHEAGNEALITVARTLARSVRDVDTASRYGGEEFVLILPSTSKTGALKVAERVRQGIEETPVVSPEGNSTQITASLGIAAYPADALDGDELIRRTDTAMYVAKRRGKNQVSLFGDERRAHQRLEMMLEGNYRLLDPDVHPISTLDISEGGILFRSSKPLRPGGLLDIQLKIPESGEDVHFSGKIVRTEQAGNNQFDVGVRIIDIGQRQLLLLRDLVRSTRSLPPGLSGPPKMGS